MNTIYYLIICPSMLFLKDLLFGKTIIYPIKRI